MKRLFAIRGRLGAGTVGAGLLTITLALSAAPSGAQEGGVLIFPKRVVFAGRARSAEVNLVNGGRRPVTYRIELVEGRMTPTGGVAAIAQPGTEHRSARGLVRYAPRQVTVPAESAQKIRLALRKPADLEPGEYRSHLLCRALPAETAGADVETLDREDAMAIRLTVTPAVSIPVIVRHGELRASVRLSDLSFEPGVRPAAEPEPGAQAAGDRPPPATTPELSFRLHRQGEPSVFGDLTATFISRHDGAETVVGIVKGVAVYPPLDSITQRLRLHPVDGLRLTGGRLRLSFRGDPENDGGAQPEAHAEIELP